MSLASRSNVPTRRSFLASMLAAGTAPLVLPGRLFSQTAPSRQLTLGCIGLGGQGMGVNMKQFLSEDDCRIVAVCDVFRERTQKAADTVNQHYGTAGCRRVDDFRAIISDPSIDAVVISTPDHWHVPMSLLALAAGKHVFCEKPTYTIGEGRDLIKAVKRSGLVFQGGIEDRSVAHYHRIIEWVRNGAIGDLYHVDVTLPAGMLHPQEPESPVPAGLNWNLWLGPAPSHAYTETRTQAMHWRFIRDYSTGMLTDWGTHLVDTAQLAVNDPLVTPVDVRAWGEPVPENMQSNIPARFDVHYRYGNGMTLRVRSGEGGESLGRQVSLRLLGSKGWIAINGWRGQFSASDPAILRLKYRPEESRYIPLPPSEQRNFLDCVRSRAKPTYDVETLHHLCVTLHAGLIAMDLGRPLRWDHANETFGADIEANQRLHVKPRADWQSG